MIRQLLTVRSYMKPWYINKNNIYQERIFLFNNEKFMLTNQAETARFKNWLNQRLNFFKTTNGYRKTIRKLSIELWDEISQVRRPKSYSVDHDSVFTVFGAQAEKQIIKFYQDLLEINNPRERDKTILVIEAHINKIIQLLTANKNEYSDFEKYFFEKLQERIKSKVSEIYLINFIIDSALDKLFKFNNLEKSTIPIGRARER